jgi:hypothetical protein
MSAVTSCRCQRPAAEKPGRHMYALVSLVVSWPSHISLTVAVFSVSTFVIVIVFFCHAPRLVLLLLWSMFLAFLFTCTNMDLVESHHDRPIQVRTWSRLVCWGGGGCGVVLWCCGVLGCLSDTVCLPTHMSFPVTWWLLSTVCLQERRGAHLRGSVCSRTRGIATR